MVRDLSRLKPVKCDKCGKQKTKGHVCPEQPDLRERVAQGLYELYQETPFGWQNEGDMTRNKYLYQADTIIPLIRKALAEELAGDIELVYSGNEHYMTANKVPDDTAQGESHWHCYIPRVITRLWGMAPKRGDTYKLSLSHNKAQVEGK